MTKHVWWNLTILPLISAVLALGQSETISFGGAELRLGMPREEVKAKLSASNHFKDSESDKKLLESIPKDTLESLQSKYGELKGNDDFVIVISKLDARYVGSVQFANGRLVRVSKSWTPRSGENTALFQALYSLISNLNQHGNTAALMKTSAYRTPEVTGERIHILFGSRMVSIIMYDSEVAGRPIRGVSLDEDYLQLPLPQPKAKGSAKP